MQNSNINIKGVYSIEMTLQGMFQNTKAIFHFTNTITNQGLQFLVEKWVGADGDFTEIIVGNGTGETMPTHTEDLFVDKQSFPVQVHVEENQLILSQNNISGRILQSTTELGVIAELPSKRLLVSRSTHTPINIPQSCILNIKYYYTLSNEET